ncbi:site-specific DNA-methyltransferase [Vreelandella janggokensis]|uniref:site-specific DNA-methyltransferase n=1 Tax=Vreelandella janggokensis TaxID=370767 RepID=UPI0028648A58|nr:site-specific DNA-methyltransferase [Halomonas janggokensis]MDR5885008.1 site-specific DNA-methyltransferase [Halomonas janggokensis]
MAANIAEDRKGRFIKLLHELFQLDKPELDFGLYRIMHAKSDQLSRFIREDLSEAIEAAFAEQEEQQLATLRHDIEEKRRQAEEFGAPDPDGTSAVKQARAAYDVAKREQNASADIYDHLYRFFSRYYDKGDFMSRRHHVAENDSRAAPYAVPYDGREVYLHWANKDQYYVKSSETLANFTFNLNEALKKLQGAAAQGGLSFDSVDSALKVHCRVVEATEGEHNDVKESTERFFIIHYDEPMRLLGADLVLQFEYRPDPEKTGQSGTWQKKRLEEAEDIIMAALRATDGVAAYRDGLATPAPTEKQKSRTLLGKYLQQYTARNTMDYFIHKDLGGFLSRELDFYIKNEILRLDDIDNADVLIVEQQLKKIQVLRKIAKQIIAFLAQLENFQKRLWLKKKFVTGVNYCLTLDFLEDHVDVVKQILNSEAQRLQWKEIYSLDIGQLDKKIDSLGLQEVLRRSEYRYLMVDTGVLSVELGDLVVSLVDDLSSKCEGVIFNSDNFQALRLMRGSLENKVKCVYIDPPYNTGDDGFPFKDHYPHSSWLSMAYDRIAACRPLLREDGVFFSHIDDNELFHYQKLCETIFGGDNFLGSHVWLKRYAPAPDTKDFGYVTEALLVFRKSPDFERGLLPFTDEQKARYKNPDNDSRGAWKAADYTCRYTAQERPTLYYKIVNPNTGEEIWPKKTRVWAFSEEMHKKNERENRIWWGKKGLNSTPALKNYVSEINQGRVPSTLLHYEEVGHTDEAAKELRNVVPGIKATPKPSRLAGYLTDVVGGEGVYLDFFAGTGSSIVGLINKSREVRKGIRYCAVEMGEYIDDVLIPRVKKTVYSKFWEAGVPRLDEEIKLHGISHCFKYLRLESYDDTLNNLDLDDKPQRDALVEQNSELRHDYTLKYLLDVETRGSASLLNTDWFRDPEGYVLKVKHPGRDETRETAVDLVETFNWLIGLHVTHLDKPRTYVARFEREADPELPEDHNTRLKAVSLRENEDGAYWIRQVEGRVRRIPGSDEDLAKVLVVWRKLTDDPEKDAAVLEALLEKYKIDTTDSEFDAIYINGPHGLNLTGRARSRVHSLEETFHARMWEGCDDEF